ncbi:Legumain like [Fasciola hepatica]|uniref:Hemoglobinase n=1 Tax=Fasciola hepatica TaxID=6192 RepID=A0A4E0RW83_FASHE|nr:Legumain like [Fasciola hepatica]
MLSMQILFYLFAYSWATCARAQRTGKNWAVLVAGSNGWYNYRHQADIAHAYQLLRGNGIPAENIITMMYDDIAFNPRNHFPGKLFNDYDHEDVYEGVKIDYRGVFVTPNMFIRVLEGDEELKADGKKVLDSEADDNLFIFFSDHGGENLISFPNGVLYSQQLVNALKRLKHLNRFKHAAVYIEACYSGSIFEGVLSKDIDVYATSASNSNESSYASFCQDVLLDTCLADHYSYSWMKDTALSDLNKKTLSEQFRAVRRAVNRSHVCEWGSESVGKRPIGEFQSHNSSKVYTNKKMFKFMRTADQEPAHKAHLVGIMRTLMNSNDEKERASAQKRLHRALQLERLVIETCDEIVATIMDKLVPNNIPRAKEEQLDCYKTIFDAFQIKCFTINQVPEVARQTPKFGKLCREGYDAANMVHVIHDVCV